MERKELNARERMIIRNALKYYSNSGSEITHREAKELFYQLAKMNHCVFSQTVTGWRQGSAKRK